MVNQKQQKINYRKVEPIDLSIEIGQSLMVKRVFFVSKHFLLIIARPFIERGPNL